MATDDNGRAAKKVDYTVTFACGHTSLVTLYGDPSTHRRKLGYLKHKGLCLECRIREEGLPRVQVHIFEDAAEGTFTVALENAYDIRETLKGFGYRFQRELRGLKNVWVITHTDQETFRLDMEMLADKFGLTREQFHHQHLEAF